MAIPLAGVYSGFNTQVPGIPPTGAAGVYLVGDLGQKPTVGQRGITARGFGNTVGDASSIQPFNTTADAIAFAFTNELGTTVLDGVTPGTAPFGHVGTAVSGTPYGEEYPTPIGGITGLTAICDGSGLTGCQLQLWYVKNIASGGFTAGQAFEITAGLRNPLYPGSTAGGILGPPSSTYNGKYVLIMNNPEIGIASAGPPFGQTGVWFGGISPNPYVITATSFNGANLWTFTVVSGHNIQPGVTVYIQQTTHASSLNNNYFVVLSRTNTTFTVYFSTGGGAFGPTSEPSSAGVTVIGWYPDTGDQVMATLTIATSSTMTNFTMRTNWVY